MRKTLAILALSASAIATAANADWLGNIGLSNITKAIDGAGIQQALQQQQAAEKAAADLKKNQSLAIQAELERIYVTLTTAPDDNLYFLKAAPDVCGYPTRLDCKVAPSTAVKPLVDVALERRKSESGQKDTQQAFYVSAGSLFVSVISLVVSSGLVGRRKRKGLE